MSIIIDKRFLPKNKTSDSRQKFIERYKGLIKRRIREMVQKGNIGDFNKGEKKVKIKLDDLDTPGFEFDPHSGSKDRIYIGNKTYKKGDKQRKSQGRGQGKGGAGNGGEGEDDFEFVLTEKEFSDLFFEDLELPNLLKKDFIGSCFEIKHAGYSTYGGPSSLNIKKTMLNAMGRRVALKAKRNRETEEFVGELLAAPKKKKLQYIEDIDLKYNFREKVDVPSTKAVMMCLMDVSGSMGDKEKDMAKRFYILLHLFLKRNYDMVDVVFVRHTTEAEEVDEKTFFYDRQSGGTMISSGYEKVNEIIKVRYNSEQWNVYIAQASDGENWPEDMENMEKVLTQQLLPATRYFAYINVASQMANYMREAMTDVMTVMKRLMQSHSNLQAKEIRDYNEIFGVFRSLFKKKEK